MFQIAEIVRHPRDKDGHLVWPDDNSDTDGKEAYRDEWRSRGLSDAEIERKYDEDLHIHCYREQLQREHATDPESKLVEFRRRILKARQWSR